MSAIKVTDDLIYIPYHETQVVQCIREKENLGEAVEYLIGYLKNVRLGVERRQQTEIEALKKSLKEIITISDRHHDAWNRAKDLLK